MKQKNKVLVIIFVVIGLAIPSFAATPLKRGPVTKPPVSSAPSSVIGESDEIVPGTEKLTTGNQAWVMQRVYAVCLERGWRHWTLSEESGQNLVKVLCQDDEDGNEYTLIGCIAKGILRVCLLMTDNDLNKDAQVFCDSFQKNPTTGQFEWVRVNSIVPHRAEEPDE